MFAAAQPALAATVSSQGSELRVTAGAGELNKITVAEGAGAFEVRDTGGAALSAGPGCTPAGDHVSCERGSVQSVKAELGDGEDTFQFTGALGTAVDGGLGDDVIRGGGGNDNINTGPGNDTALGSAGVDRLYGADGTDSLEGGNGNDLLDGGSGPDTLVAGDGGDSVIGGDGDDQLEAGKGSDSLDGGAGNDRLLTAEGEFTGDREVQIRCGSGADSARIGPADPFVTDCELMDGASIRLTRRGVPLVIVCPAACRATARISDARRRVTGAKRFTGAAGKPTRVNVKLGPDEILRLQLRRKLRMTLRVGGVRATFTLLRAV